MAWSRRAASRSTATAYHSTSFAPPTSSARSLNAFGRRGTIAASQSAATAPAPTCSPSSRRIPMDREGPALEALMRRLAEAPEDFLADPKVGGAGRVHVAAVVGDLVRMLGGDVLATDLRDFTGASGAGDRNRLAVVLMLCW